VLAIALSNVYQSSLHFVLLFDARLNLRLLVFYKKYFCKKLIPNSSDGTFDNQRPPICTCSSSRRSFSSVSPDSIALARIQKNEESFCRVSRGLKALRRGMGLTAF